MKTNKPLEGRLELFNEWCREIYRAEIESGKYRCIEPIPSWTRVLHPEDFLVYIAVRQEEMIYRTNQIDQEVFRNMLDLGRNYYG